MRNSILLLAHLAALNLAAPRAGAAAAPVAATIVPGARPLALATLVQRVSGSSSFIRGGARSRVPINLPPTGTSSLGPNPTVWTGEQLRFSIEFTDPEGEDISATLRNPMQGMVATPLVGAASPATLHVDWLVTVTSGGLHRLVFDVTDSSGASTTELLDVLVLGSVQHQPMLTGDLDGDGALDMVVATSVADVAGVTDVGAIYVWSGTTAASGPPTATLTVPGASANDRLGAFQNTRQQGIQLADVTGDGILDLVACAGVADVGGVQDAGAVYVWKGGAGFSGSLSPTATLTAPGANPFDALGYIAHGQGVHLMDVTDDGIRDVIAGTRAADIAGVNNVGAIYVWSGGDTLSGTPPPSATLSVPGATANDLLCNNSGPNPGLLVGEVTGDGVLDLVASTDRADIGGVADAGALYVWSGGSGLSGSVAPTATLTVPGASPSDRLGYDGHSSRSVFMTDLDGDGSSDLIASATLADIGGVSNTGAVYVWYGGASLVGSSAPSATLTVPAAAASDTLGNGGGPGTRGVHAVDVTGDGLLDIVAAAENADVAGVQNAGAIYVWSGVSGFSGSLSPTATLTVPGAQIGDNLTNGNDTSVVAQGLLFEDVTSDGIKDLIAAAVEADIAGVTDVGAIYVWAGGTGLTGNVSPTATLSVSGAAHGDLLTHLEGQGQGFLVGDVTGDPSLDIIAGAAVASFGGQTSAGAIYVWAGGASLSGTPLAQATLGLMAPAPLGYLGRSQGQGIVLGDVSGDGRKDVLALGSIDDLNGVHDSGGVYVWFGDDDLTGVSHPAVQLSDMNARADDLLGLINPSVAGGAPNPIQLGDMSGDGILDVLAGSGFADVPPGLPSAQNVGALYAWKGGPTLTGLASDPAKMITQNGVPGDMIGTVAGHGIFLLDATGTGAYGVFVGASDADVNGVTDTGALYFWGTPTQSTGLQFEDLELTVPGASAQDSLGT